MRRGWPGLRAVAMAAGLGVLVACGQAPLGAWYLALPALAVLCWLIGRSAAPVWLAWFAGAGYFGAALNWIVQPFMVDAARDGWMAPFALVLMAFGMALFWALAGWVSRYARSAALGFAVALAATDLLRGYVLTGFPWALIGHIWIETPVAQLAAYVGPSGLSLLTALLAAGLALRRPLPASLAAVSLESLGVLACGCWGSRCPLIVP